MFNVDDDWIGEEMHSWTPIGEPYKTIWEATVPTFMTNFNINDGTSNSQDGRGVALTPKGWINSSANNYLTIEDCMPSNRKQCGSGKNIDCTILQISDTCTLGQKLVVATCDNAYDSPQWSYFALECKKVN